MINSDQNEEPLIEEKDLYTRNPHLIRLMKWFFYVHLFMGFFQVMGIIMMSLQNLDIPSDCSQLNRIFVPYLISFIAGLFYVSTNIFAIRNSENKSVSRFKLVAFFITLSLKITFVIQAVTKRNRNIGMCFFYSGQNIFFIVEGCVEIACLLVTFYLSYALTEMIEAKNLTGKLEFLKILKKYD